MPPNSRRRLAEDSDSSDFDDDEDFLKRTPAMSQNQVQYCQSQIMMHDLGTVTRDHITAANAGPQARPVNQRQIAQARECNQEGTAAALLATANHQMLSGWAAFYATDAADAGIEDLDQLDGGNAHRMRTKSLLEQAKQENGGDLGLEDTYRDYAKPNNRPAFRNHAGSAAAFNDRGGYGRGRGGGFAGRTGGRGGGAGSSVPQNRPLDPAVDPNRFYGYKDTKSKRAKTVGHMNNNGIVVMNASSATSAKKKQPKMATRSTTRPQNRGPLPAFLSPNLTSGDDFMTRALLQFRQNADSGSSKAAPAAPASKGTIAKTQSVPTEAPSMVSNPSSKTVSTPQKKESPTFIQKIHRSELATQPKSPSAFTDGQATTGSLSGFSPSLNGDGISSAAVDPTVGLGISGVALSGPKSKVVPPKEELLMDTGIPAANSAGLTSPLIASPRSETVAIAKSEWEQYQEFKKLKASDRPEQDLVVFLQRLKNANKEKNDTAVSLAGGYSIGSASLERIIGDQPKASSPSSAAQVSPGLAQSKYAAKQVVPKATVPYAPAVSTASMGATARDGVRPGTILSEAKSAALNDATQDRGIGAVPIRSLSKRVPVSNGGDELQKQLQSLNKSMAGLDITAKAGPASSVKSDIKASSAVSRVVQPPLKTIPEAPSVRTIKEPVSQLQRFHRATSQSASPSIEASAIKAKPNNPFAPRETIDHDEQKVEPNQAAKRTQVSPAKKVASKLAEIKLVPSDSENLPRTRDSGRLPVMAQAPAKKSIMASKWASPESDSMSSPLRSMPVNQANAGPGPIFGDSNNLRASRQDQKSMPAPAAGGGKPSNQGAKLFENFVPTQSVAKGLTATGSIKRTNAGPGLAWILEEQKQQKIKEDQQQYHEVTESKKEPVTAAPPMKLTNAGPELWTLPERTEQQRESRKRQQDELKKRQQDVDEALKVSEDLARKYGRRL